MDTGELIALVLILLILVVGTSLVCVRFWKAVVAEMKDSQTPRRDQPQDLTTSFRNVLRESFRSSLRRVGSLRRRPPTRPQIGNTPPVTRVSTIEDLTEGRSELHPKYLSRKSQTAESANGSSAVITNDSTSGKPHCESVGTDNPSIQPDVVNPATTHEPNPQIPSHQFYKDSSAGYDQPADQDYYVDIPDRLVAALPSSPTEQEVNEVRTEHADEVMAAHEGVTGCDVLDRNACVQSDTYI